MGGYIERVGPAIGMHDPLFVKAAAFRHGEAATVLLSIDILYVSHEWTQELKSAIYSKTGVPPDNILVAGTHTHSGPAVFSPMSGEKDQIAAYETGLMRNCIEAAGEALAAAEPARLRAGALAVEGVGGNRRDPDASGSTMLSVIRVENTRGGVLGHLASFACHPTVMGPANLDYSADLFGATASEVEKEYDGSACLMFSGAAGNMSTRFVRREQTWVELERLGRELAKGIATASRSSEPMQTDCIFGIGKAMEIPFCDIPDPETAQTEYDRASEKAQAASDDWPRERLARSLVEGAAAKLLLSRMGGWQPIFGTTSARIEVQVIRIGDIIIYGLPGEFFSVRESELREAALPKFGFLAGYANGYWGYLVPPEEASKGGYETMMSPIDSEKESEIIGAAKGIIRTMIQKTVLETTGNA
jgi:hypothetical protein